MGIPDILTRSFLLNVVFLAIAIACGFMGYRLQRGLIALAVLLEAFVLFRRIGLLFLPDLAAVGVAVVAAVVVAAFSYRLYLAGVFAAMVILAVSVSGTIIEDRGVALVAGIIVGCVLGLLAVKMNRPIVILVTGLVGGLTAAKYAVELLKAATPLGAIPDEGMLVVVLVLAAAGILVQFQSTKRDFIET